MNGDTGDEGMEIVLLARVFLALAVMAATTAVVKWLVSNQKKKTKAGSDADKAALCLGRQSLEDVGSRDQESDALAWEEVSAPPQLQVPRSNGSARSYSSRGRTEVLKFSCALEQGHGCTQVCDGVANNSSPCAGRETKTNKTSRDTGHQQEGNWLKTASAAPLFPKHGTVATGEPNAKDCEMAPESNQGRQPEEGMEGCVTPPGGVVGTYPTSVGLRSPGFSPHAHTDPHPGSSDANSLLLVSVLPVQTKQSRSHDIDYVATGSHGDSKPNSPDVEVSFENQSGLGIDPPGEPDSSSGAAALCNGYTLLCGERAVCQEKRGQGESLPATEGASQHLDTPVPPLQRLQEEGEDGHRGLQDETLNSVLSERGATEPQCPWEAHPVGNTKQTKKPVSGFTTFEGGINGGKSYSDPTDGNLPTCSLNSTHSIPSLDPTDCEANGDCKEHERLEFLAGQTAMLDSGESSNGKSEPDIRRQSSGRTNAGLHWEGQTVHALPVKDEATSWHLTQEKAQLHGEDTCSEVGLHNTPQNAEEYPKGVTDAQEREESYQFDFPKCDGDDTQQDASDLERRSTLGQPKEHLLTSPSQEESDERETRESKEVNTIDTDLMGEDRLGNNSDTENEPGSQETNPDRAQLKRETSPFQGNLFSSTTENATTTKSGHEWVNVDAGTCIRPFLEKKALSETVMPAEPDARELLASHVSSNSHNVPEQLSTEDVSMIESPQHAEHDFLSLSAPKADPPGTEKYSHADPFPEGKNSFDVVSGETAHGFGQSNNDMVEPDLNIYSSNQINASLHWEGQAVERLTERDEATSGCQTQENEQVQAEGPNFEVDLQTTLLNVKECSLGANEACDYGQCYQGDLSKVERDDTQVWTSGSTLEEPEKTLAQLLSQPESKAGKMHKANDDDSIDTNPRRKDCRSSNNSGFKTEHGAQGRNPDTAKSKTEDLPSHEELFSFTTEAATTTTAVWLNCEADSVFSHFLEKEVQQEELALPESVISAELQEQELSASRVSNNGHNVTEQPSVEYLSTLELSHHAQHNFLPLSSPGMEKCRDAGPFPVGEDSSHSLINVETTHDSGQSDNEMAELDLNRNPSIRTTAELHCKRHTGNPFTVTEETASGHPRKEAGQLDEEVGLHSTPQNVADYRLEASIVCKYGESSQANLSKCDNDEGQVCSSQQDKGFTLGQAEDMRVLSLSQGESKYQEHWPAKDEDFADTEPRKEDTHGNKSGFETEPCTKGVNPERALFITENMTMDMAATLCHDEGLYFVTETALTTRSGDEWIHGEAGPGLSHLQGKDACPADLGSVILTELKDNEFLQSHVNNESHDVAEQLSAHSVFTVGPSQHDEFNCLSSLSANVGLPGMGEINDADTLPMREGSSSNVTDLCHSGGTEGTRDVKPEIYSENQEAFTTKNQKTELCHSTHEDSVESSSPSEKQQASVTKSQESDSRQSIHEDSVGPFCPSEKQEASTANSQKINSLQSIHEDYFGSSCPSEKQEAYTTKTPKTDLWQSIYEDSVGSSWPSEKQVAYTAKSQKTDSWQIIHEDSVRYFSSSDKQEASIKSQKTESWQSIHEEFVGFVSPSEEQEASTSNSQKTDSRRSIHEDAVGSFCSSEKQEVTTTKNQNTDLRQSIHGGSVEPSCAEQKSIVDQLHPGINSNGISEISDKQKRTKQLSHVPEYTLPNKETAYFTDVCELKEEMTPQHEDSRSCVSDGENSYHYVFEMETITDENLYLNNHLSTPDGGINLDSETSESGYITENINTPVYEERSWSSLEADGEEVESSYREPVATVQEMEWNSDTRSVTRQGQRDTKSATVNCKHSNQEDSTSEEDNPEEKDNLSTAGSQCSSVKSGVEDSDTSPHTPTIMCICEGGETHIDFESLPFQESMKDKLKDFCREGEKICQPSSNENIRICGNTDASHLLEEITFNMSSDHMEALEETREQSHNHRETWPQLDTAEDTERAMAFVHGHPAAQNDQEEEKSHNDAELTEISSNMHYPGVTISADNRAGCFGTIQQTLKETNQTHQFEDIDNNICVDKAQPDNHIGLFSQCTSTKTGASYESSPIISLEETPAVETAMNTKEHSSKPESLGTATTERKGLLPSGNESQDISTASGQSTCSGILENHTGTEQECSVPKTSKEDNKPSVLDFTMPHGLMGTYESGCSQPEDISPITLNIVSGENEPSPEYVHPTRSHAIPRTLSLPSSALRRIHPPPETLRPVIPCNPTTSFERTGEDEHQLKSNNDYSSSSVPLPAKVEHQTSPGRSGLQRRGSISEIAENPELRLCGKPTSPKVKVPQLAKSCENILSDTPSINIDGRSKTRSMLCLLTEHYSLPVSKSHKSPVEFVAKGSFLSIPEALQSMEDAMKMQLNLGNCLELLKFAKKNRAVDLQEAAYMVMSDNYLQVLRDPALYGQLNGGERDRILQLRMRGKKVLGVAELETIYGLKKTMQSSSCPAVNELPPHYPHTDLQQQAWLYTFDMDKNSWHSLTQIPKEANLKGCSICSLNNYLFLAGGIKGHGQDAVCSNKVFCYNPLTEIWRQVAPMKQARSQLKLVSADGYLYAIGGECLYTVERYDPRLDKWTFRASLPKGSFAVAHEAATCNGEIYVSGGHLFYRLLKYNPPRDLWEECPYNTSRKRSSDMVAVRNFIYRFDIHRDSGVSVFKYNTTSKIWNECATMCLSNPLPFRCVVLGEAVYCLNKKMTVRFSTDDRSQRFEPENFCVFLGGDRGALCPFVLTMPQPISLQTSV